MAVKKKLGNDCKLYRNSGTWASPTWNEITEVSDVSLPQSKGRGEFRTRASKYVKKKGGKIEAAINAKYTYDPGDDDFTVLLASFNTGTTIDMAILDGPVATAGSQGLRAECEVMEFPIDQPLEEGVTIDMVLEPTVTDNEPVWFTAS